MVVPVIGSMAVKGVFKAGGLLSGLGSTSGKLKEVQQRSKSTSTEMKRMTGQANLLKGALAAIGIAGFSALLMTTPQLAGALAKIKVEMQLIAWAIGKHLKPALDTVATILHGIRTGDWSTVIRGVKELTDSLVDLASKVVSGILDPIIGKETTDKLKTDFSNWLDEMAKIAKEKNLWAAIWEGSVIGVTWVLENLELLNAWCETFLVKFDEVATALTDFVTPEWMKEIAREIERFDAWIGRTVYEPLGIDLHKLSGGIIPPERQVGGMIGRTGMYKMHAGETVTMAGSSPGGIGGTTDITVDFSGANINLAGGIELNQFADAISMKIAEKQQSLTY